MTQKSNMDPAATSYLSYFRNTLADTVRVQPDDRTLESGLTVDEGFAEVAVVGPSQFELLKKKNSANAPLPSGALSVVWAPVVWRLRPEHAQHRNGLPKILTPLCIPLTLDSQGVCEFSRDQLPWIARVLLMPVFPERLAIGTVEVQDRFYASNPFDSTEQPSLRDALTYGNRLFRAVADGEARDVDFGGHGYERQSGGLLYVPNPMASFAYPLINLYDAIIRDDIESAVLSDIVSPSNTFYPPGEIVPSPYEYHLGHMDVSPALSESQRKAMIRHLVPLRAAVAVQGPPGTGKTELCTNIAANMLVRQVSDDIDSSTGSVVVLAHTNQAVAAALSKSNTRARWIKSAGGIALLCLPPSKDKADTGMPVLTLSQLQGGVIHPALTEGFISNALGEYLLEASTYFRRPFSQSDLPIVVDLLKRELDHRVRALKGCYRIQGAKDGVVKARSTLCGYADPARYEEWSQAWKDAHATRMNTLKRIRDVYMEWKFFAENEPVWLSLIRVVPGLSQRTIDARNKSFFSPLKLNLGIRDYSDSEGITRRLAELFQRVRNLCKESQLVIAQIKHVSEQEEVLESNEYDRDLINVIMDDEPSVDDYRRENYSLALRVREGQWLIKRLQDFATFNRQGRPGEDRRRVILTALAELYPIVGCTLFTAPRFFGETLGDVYQPFAEFFGLAIVDEAGQVTCDVGISSVFFGRKAVIVGDHMQIEPIYTITNVTDAGNALQSGVIKKASEWPDLIATSVTASSGNFARFTLGACDSVILEEQFRSDPQIVSFLNELCYQGNLKAIRSGLNQEVFQFVPVIGKIERFYGSKYNVEEAYAVSHLIMHHGEKWKSDFNISSIGDVVGVITPFSRQVAEIKRALREFGLDDVKVGTVHAFQGAEFPVVVFSPVESYRASERNGTPFFDVGKNMINVAVSRAKYLFVTVGDISGWEDYTLSASGRLFRFLTQRTTQRISDLPLKTKGGNGLVASTNKKGYIPYRSDDFADLIKGFLQNAGDTVVIASPEIGLEWLRYNKLLETFEVVFTRCKDVTVIVNPVMGRNFDAAGYERVLNSFRSRGARIIEYEHLVDSFVWMSNKLIWSLSPILSGKEFNAVLDVHDVAHEWCQGRVKVVETKEMNDE